MRSELQSRIGWLLALVTVMSLIIGCGSNVDTDTAPKASEAAATGHNHNGWWCTEHGIPEHDCSMCSSKAAAKLKEKGDWCEKHNRAESQCFICDPSRAEKFAKLYEAKFGEKPPKATK